ncbi:nagb/rpia/CoA transferase-like protein [Mollisia scopiformis]|uniref:Nagb/rpia/CoA transferase-like protein n=1 Tax=Mollisia scopiformis TaxID=149040 RepID=A0A194WTW9_MOLSC|nr:nagb/rpia/CoA transferase-like protein [Mollisia scopiformis]KUJ11386.1 nagb/rpia/CoA transferase-like protein [Mollisia scopiformis]
MSSNLRKRSVVSSFICTPPNSPSGFTFALFKRSQDVSTYRGKWAVCSGSIDKTDLSPAAAAKREILEETQLSDCDISLLRRGRPFSLIDEALQTEWTIHPFAWQLKEGANQIKFDWEHIEFKFIKPEDLSSYDHVPQLEVGLERVVVSPMTQKALTALRNDHESGAQALALKALDFLLEAARSEELAGIWSSEEYWKELRWRAWHLAKNGRPSMAAAIESSILNALEDIESHVSEDGGGKIATCSLSRLTSIIESVISSKLDSGASNLDPIARSFTDLILPETKGSDKESRTSMNITTISASGTVRTGLLRAIPQLIAQGIAVKLTVLESRPNFEGASFVNTLLDQFQGDSDILNKLKFEIVSDASVANAVKDAHFVVFGGDKVIPNGDVSNKIGSFSLAAIAKTVSPACKVVAMFETNKITGSGFDSEYLAVEENDPDEIINAWPLVLQSDLYMKETLGAQVKVKNEYFEWVPARFVDHYITEKGLWGVEEIAKAAAELEEREKRLFGEL